MSLELHISSHPEIAEVLCLSSSAVDWQRPFVGIIGSLHGNEPCGRLALAALEQAARSNELPILGGTVFLIHGNPEASAQNKRHTEGGADLNRLFSFEFVDNLPETRWTPEHHRALELRELLDELDIAVDLHSATAPTPPFGIVSTIPESGELGRKLGLPYLTHGWEGPGQLGDRVMMHMLTRRGKPSIAVECGQHEDPRAVERAFGTAKHFLVAAGVLDAPYAPKLPDEPPLELNIVDAVKKPSPGFQFHGAFIGLQQISAGTVFGSDENLEIRSKRRGFVIMPNASVEVGQDMLYLAHQVDPATLVPPDC